MTAHAIAAGMLADLAEDPTRVVETAARAGFSGVGLRYVPVPPEPPTFADVRRALDATGLRLLDLEAVRLVPGDRTAPANARVVAAAIELRPSYLTTVCWEPDRAHLVEWLDVLCAAVNPAGVVPALEFMPFSTVHTFAEARSVVEEVGIGRAVVLVDNLHVTRSGDGPDVTAAVPPELVPFVQLCDAPAVGPRDDDGLLDEALRGRVLPGEGGLPVTSFLRALPASTVISVETLSDDLLASVPADERAAMTRAALERSLRLAGLEAS